MAKSKKLKITVIQENFKLKHLRILSQAATDITAVPVHELLEALDELILEKMDDFPVDALEDIVSAIGEVMNDLGEGDSGN